MSGKPINSEQVKLYMKERKVGKSQKAASAKSGISERSGRRIEKGELQASGCKKRYWRTRPDPFSEVWESEIVPLLSKESELTQRRCSSVSRIVTLENIPTVNCVHSNEK